MSSVVAARVARFAAQQPHGVAIRTLRLDWTWLDVNAAAAALCREFEKKRVPPGSFVLIVAGQSPLAVVAAVAANQWGVVPAIVDGRDQHHVAEAITLLRPSAIVAAGARVPSEVQTLTLSASADERARRWLAVGEVAFDFAQAPAESALVVFSSGTTAVPKATVWSEGRLLGLCVPKPAWDAHQPTCMGLMRCLGLAGDALYAIGMLVDGITIAVLDVMIAAEPALSAVEALGVTKIVCAPTQAALMVRSRCPVPRCLRSVRVSGGPVSAEALLELRDYLGRTMLSKSYGLGELGVVSVLSPEDLPRKPASSGLVGPSNTVSIVDGRGVPLGVGEEGALVIRHHIHSACDGYWVSPSAPIEAFAGGVFAPQDRGFVDEEGFLTITGRESEVLKVGGQRVSALHIERVLGRSGVAAVGVPDARNGEVPAVVFVPSGLEDEGEQLRRVALRGIRGAAVPRWFLPRRELPLTQAGKLDRQLLGREAHRFVSWWPERLAVAGRLWSARFVDACAGSGLLLVDDLPPIPSANRPVLPAFVGARNVGIVRSGKPHTLVAVAQIQDGLDLATAGVRVVALWWLDQGCISERLAAQTIRDVCRTALLLPGPLPALVVAVPGDELGAGRYRAAGLEMNNRSLGLWLCTPDTLPRGRVGESDDVGDAIADSESDVYARLAHVGARIRAGAS